MFPCLRFLKIYTIELSSHLGCGTTSRWEGTAIFRATRIPSSHIEQRSCKHKSQSSVVSFTNALAAGSFQVRRGTCCLDHQHNQHNQHNQGHKNKLNGNIPMIILACLPPGVTTRRIARAKASAGRTRSKPGQTRRATETEWRIKERSSVVWNDLVSYILCIFLSTGEEMICYGRNTHKILFVNLRFYTVESAGPAEYGGMSTKCGNHQARLRIICSLTQK